MWPLRQDWKYILGILGVPNILKILNCIEKWGVLKRVTPTVYKTLSVFNGESESTTDFGLTINKKNKLKKGKKILTWNYDKSIYKTKSPHNIIGHENKQKTEKNIRIFKYSRKDTVSFI